MAFVLFNKQPVIDPSSSDWIFEAFGWLLQNFDADFFYSDIVLVRPTNEFFPDTVNSVRGKAESVSERVKGYTGISHWLTLVQDQSACQLIETQQVVIQVALRGPEGISNESEISNKMQEVDRLKLIKLEFKSSADLTRAVR